MLHPAEKNQPPPQGEALYLFPHRDDFIETLDQKKVGPLSRLPTNIQAMAFDPRAILVTLGLRFRRSSIVHSSAKFNSESFKNFSPDSSAGQRKKRFPLLTRPGVSKY